MKASLAVAVGLKTSNVISSRDVKRVESMGVAGGGSCGVCARACVCVGQEKSEGLETPASPSPRATPQNGGGEARRAALSLVAASRLVLPPPLLPGNKVRTSRSAPSLCCTSMARAN